MGKAPLKLGDVSRPGYGGGSEVGCETSELLVSRETFLMCMSSPASHDAFREGL